MTNREFMAFVRRPRYIEDIDGIQLYEDPVYDATRKRYYWKNVSLMVPVTILYLALAYYLSDSQKEFWFNFLVFFVGGVGLMWTFTEYYAHRFALHRELNLDPDAPADGNRLARLFSSHLHHHVFIN